MERGFFLKMLGIGAGAATVAKGNIKDNSETEFKNQWLGEPFPDNLPGGFQTEKLNSYHFNDSPIQRTIICFTGKNNLLNSNIIGTMHMLLGNRTIPENYLELKGQSLLIKEFGELNEAVYVGNGNNLNALHFYRSNDANGLIRNPKGKYLILPDARGKSFPDFID